MPRTPDLRPAHQQQSHCGSTLFKTYSSQNARKNKPLHCIVLYCIVLYCIALHCIVLYCVNRIKIENGGNIFVSGDTKSSCRRRGETSKLSNIQFSGKRLWSYVFDQVVSKKDGPELDSDWEYCMLVLQANITRFVHCVSFLVVSKSRPTDTTTSDRICTSFLDSRHPVGYIFAATATAKATKNTASSQTGLASTPGAVGPSRLINSLQSKNRHCLFLGHSFCW